MENRKIVDIDFSLKVVGPTLIAGSGNFDGEGYKAYLRSMLANGWQIYSHVYCGTREEGFIFSTVFVKYE